MNFTVKYFNARVIFGFYIENHRFVIDVKLRQINI